MLKKAYLIAGSIAALILAVIAVWFLVAGLSEQPDEGLPQEIVGESESPPPFELEVNGLEPLRSGNVYELWILKGDRENVQAISLGRFNIRPDGRGRLDGFVQTAPEITPGETILITVEDGSTDTADQPSTTIVLSGEVGQDTADEINLTFPFDFSRSGENNYILGTPTNDPIDLESAGIWFVQPGGREPSLNLSDTEAGWRYEGWVFHQGQYLSGGRFGGVRSGDDFNGYSSVKPAPDFPGEDFLENLPEEIKLPVNLSNGKSRVVISLEPELELLGPEAEARNQPASEPYIVLLEADIPEGAAAHTLYLFELKDESFPDGSFKLNTVP